MKRIKLYKTLAIITLSILVNTTTNAALVGHYEFNGNANDTSGNNKHGNAIGAVLTNDRFGNPNRAYRFDGTSSRIELPTIYTQDQDPLTISAWINPTANSQIGTIFGEYVANGGVTSGDTRNFFILSHNGSAGTMNFDQYAPTQGGVAIGGGLGSNWWTHRGGWFHIALVKNNDFVSMYINGLLIGSKAHSETYSGSAPSFAAIGARHLSNGNWAGYTFTGDIDDVQLYNSALSANDIQNLSAVPVPAAVWLFGSALIGLLGIRRKRN
ncbi:MAG: LamG-like jellyroll fold domain-containing protein [Gammaproteobacteria bacterium]